MRLDRRMGAEIVPLFNQQQIGHPISKSISTKAFEVGLKTSIQNLLLSIHLRMISCKSLQGNTLAVKKVFQKVLMKIGSL